MPINNGGGASGITIELDPNSLPLTGGTLTGDLTIDGGASGNKSFVINSVENWTIGMSDGTIEGWRNDPNDVPFNSYHLAVDGNEAIFKNYEDEDGSHWNQTQICGSSINLYTYEGLLSSNLTNSKLEFNNDGANLGRLTKDSLRFEDGVTDITIDATGIKFPNQYFNSSLSRGSFDSGRSSYNGISLFCTQGIELNWQAGYLKALNGSYVVPINVESNIVLTKNIDGVEEETSPYTRTTTISLDGSISYNGNNNFGDHTFNLNEGGVNGDANDNTFGLGASSVGGSQSDGQYTFGLNSSGVGGFNDYHTWGIGTSGAGGSQDGDSPWSAGVNGFSANNESDTCELNGTGVAGYNDSTSQTWGFGINGLTFVDGTVQTTAYTGGTGGSLDAGTISGNDYNAILDSASISFNENGADANSSFNRLELRVTTQPYFYSSLNGDRLYIYNDNEGIGLTVNPLTGITFNNGTTINNPTAGNSGLSQSGNIAHSDYPKEIQLVIGGVTYAIPARLV